MSTASGVPFDRVCLAMGIAPPLAEYKFAIHIKRNWRFDWAWPARKVALEVEGGLWNVGRHQRPAGFREDIAKYNCAALEGWCVLRCEPSSLSSDATIGMVRRVLRDRPLVV